MISIQTQNGEEELSLAEFEARVKTGGVSPSTQVRFPILTGDRWVDAREIELFGRLYHPGRVYFARRFSLRGFPLLTTGLVIAQVLFFFAIAGANRSLDVDPLISAGAKVRSNILELGETWRLLTANVLHRDIVHLAFNMFFLFNVGGTIENAYRKQDYILLLVFSALTTTLVSTLFGTLPSVGASGMVLGLFGAVSVFGYKYSDILPRRYRNYFVFAVLPYTLFILYVGLFNRDTDNWGHFGGLLGGSVVAMFLEPKLLHVSKPAGSYFRDHWPALTSVSLVAVTLVSGFVIRSVDPDLIPLEDRESGISIAYPSGWTFGQNHLGYVSFGNTLGATIGVRARRHTEHPVFLPEARRIFLEEELARPEGSGEITNVHVLRQKEIPIDGGSAMELEIALESRAGPQKTTNLLIARGYYSYFVVLSAPVPWADKYEPLFHAMLEQVHLIDTHRLIQSRERAKTFAGMSSAHVELATELAQLGRVEAAKKAYGLALETLPEHPDALYGLAKLSSDYGGDLVRAEAIATALYARRPESPEVAALLADLRARLGQIERARAVLEETLDRMPDAAGLRERLLRLR